MMEVNKGAGILSIVLGLIFILFPMFSSGLVSVIVGLSLLFFGISSVYLGYNMRNEFDLYSKTTIIIGIIAIIFGFLFIFYIDALSFLIAIQFYIVGFIMIIFGISGLISRMGSISTFTSILVLIMGIIAIALAAFSINQPVYIAIIIGIVLIIEGVALILSN
ncbi:DUF308 domain-containing protein [uncultured Methanobrevibacter sp.]|uniref:DUF308 domain-containing protein n=1 Tax=uncultured Methanobrevibacter sp. TaxID=253161 RepID=UPI00260E87E2|nr:DUF308 domain-containing protein [uncultured Methanobrevibacter sp.]